MTTESAIAQLNRSERGQKAAAHLDEFLDRVPFSLDAKNRQALLYLLHEAIWDDADRYTVRDALAPIVKGVR